jgi:hypothetical protein
LFSHKPVRRKGGSRPTATFEGFPALQAIHVTIPETICIIKACIMIDISIG